ncbi:dihydropteroate synthase [Faunimonas sp. B44]|uniref:dihydropteroate synthase n=1 Tax=Faunimonas sp. B44 TaxID=3461493 RepID=UPI0040444F00
MSAFPGKSLPEPNGASADRGGGFASLLRRWRAGEIPPLVMGIINVTPDSFSDGGKFADHERAIAEGRRMVADGAAILDIGGESTRPNATPVPENEERRRILPVIDALAGREALISADTIKASVAAAALDAGAQIVNDIRGLQGDPDMAAVAAAAGAGLVIMHNPGLLGSSTGTEGDPVQACLAFFETSLAIAACAGVKEDRIVLDPGFGFGKSTEQQVQMLARFDEFGALGFPVLAGISRKSILGKLTGRVTEDRVTASTVAHFSSMLSGAAIVRAHDVVPHVDAARIAHAIRRARAERATS